MGPHEMEALAQIIDRATKQKGIRHAVTRTSFRESVPELRRFTFGDPYRWWYGRITSRNRHRRVKVPEVFCRPSGLVYPDGFKHQAGTRCMAMGCPFCHPVRVGKAFQRLMRAYRRAVEQGLKPRILCLTRQPPFNFARERKFGIVAAVSWATSEIRGASNRYTPVAAVVAIHAGWGSGSPRGFHAVYNPKKTFAQNLARACVDWFKYPEWVFDHPAAIRRVFPIRGSEPRRDWVCYGLCRKPRKDKKDGKEAKAP